MAGLDGCFFFSWRDGAVVFFSEAGRGGFFFFPQRDGAVVVFFRGGTGRLLFFSEAGRGGCFFFRGGTGRGGCVFSAPEPGGCIFCSRRDGRFFFSAGTGRLTVVVFSAGTVLPTGNDEDGTRELQILAPCL